MLFSVTLYGQILIKGRVVSLKGKPLEGASVYLNNTTIGVYTNKNGEFELPIKEGTYTLIASFMGYSTIQQQINSSTNNKYFLLNLIPNTNILDEVIVKKNKYDDEWKYNVHRFKKAFLGRSLLAQNCIILNPKTLSFDYDVKTKILTASTQEPLIIKNKDLGYLITYDLIEFVLETNKLTYLGYTKYENLKTKVKKSWVKNRAKAYHGSRMHFMRSLRIKKLKNEGFVVNQFKRVLNTERPSDSDILKAKELIKLNGGHLVLKKVTNPKTSLDSAFVVIQKSRLPKYRDYLYKKNIPYSDIILISNNNITLHFKDYLSVIYTKESEENNYLKQSFIKRLEPLGVQTSTITLTTKTAVIDYYGNLINPLAIFTEGYWSFEQFAETLPLDFKPLKD